MKREIQLWADVFLVCLTVTESWITIKCVMIAVVTVPEMG